MLYYAFDSRVERQLSIAIRFAQKYDWKTYTPGPLNITVMPDESMDMMAP